MAGTNTRRRDALFFAACCIGYVVCALYLNSYGAAAPLMMAWYGIDAAQQGLLLTMQSIGGTALSFFFLLKGDSLNKLHSIAAGLAILGGGCILMGMAPQYGFLLFVAVCCGCGYAFVDVMVNGALADVYPEKKDTLLTIVHAVYAVGSTTAPVMVSWMVNPSQARTFVVPFLTEGMLALAILIFYLVCARPIRSISPYGAMRSTRRSASPQDSVYRTKTAWILLVAAILYFSFQMGVSAWLPSYGLEAGVPYDSATLMTSGFFAGALAMGFLAALLLKWVSARNLFGWLGIASALCMVIALFAQSPAVLTPFVVLSGFFQGAGVSTLVIVLVDAFPHMSGSASAVQVTGANIGAITSPLWIGAIAETTGFRFPLLISCGMYIAGAMLVLLYAPGGWKYQEKTSKSARVRYTRFK